MVRLDPSGWKETKWHEYAVRFLFGGIITLAAGIIAKIYGPGVGGLFLAFPAILPASATLIETHVRKEGGSVRKARDTASLDVAGAAQGSVGLLSFAVIVWYLIRTHHAYFVLGGSALAWFAVAVGVWRIMGSKDHKAAAGPGQPHPGPRTQV